MQAMLSQALLPKKTGVIIHPNGTIHAARMRFSLAQEESTPKAVNEAIYIGVLFNIIDRIADALNFTIPSSFKGRSAKLMLKLGYAL
jgi:hypothetical protein